MDLQSLRSDRGAERAGGHGIFGYTGRTDSYFDSIVQWVGKDMAGRWKLTDPSRSGVVPALSMSVLAFTQPGDGILVQPPYTLLLQRGKWTGRRIVENPLVFRDGRFEMDFDDLEKDRFFGKDALSL